MNFLSVNKLFFISELRKQNQKFFFHLFLMHVNEDWEHGFESGFFLETFYFFLLNRKKIVDWRLSIRSSYEYYCYIVVLTLYNNNTHLLIHSYILILIKNKKEFWFLEMNSFYHYRKAVNILMMCKLFKKL